MNEQNWLRLSPFQIRLTKSAVLLTDLLSFGLAGLVAAWLARTFTSFSEVPWLESQDLERYWVWVGVVVFGLAIFLIRYRHYSDRKPFWTELGELLFVIFGLAVLDLALLALARWNASRLWWAAFWPLGMLFVPVGRGLIRAFMRQIKVWQRPTIIVGNGPNAREAIAALQSEPSLGFSLVDFVDLIQPASTRTAQLQRWSQVPGVQFVLATEHHENDIREGILRQLARWKVENISVIPAMRGIPLFGTDMAYFFSHEVALLKLRNNLRYWPARLLKRVFDLVAALIILLVTGLPIAYLIWRIRQDGGPAVFAHQRMGQSGRVFPCYKFRTMHVDAEEQLRTLLTSDPASREQWSREFKLKMDPRVTPIGRFLRRTSLDELPQLINVIRGEMSLVGPRPIIQEELTKYGDDADYFLMVRPGMTGLWQVSGRSDTSYETRVYLDTWYVKNWSLWYDIAILFKTIRVVFSRSGAY